MDDRRTAALRGSGGEEEYRLLALLVLGMTVVPVCSMLDDEVGSERNCRKHALEADSRARRSERVQER